MSRIERPEVGERVLRLLTHMVAVPTESSTPNRELIEWLADHLLTFGSTVSIIDGPPGRANLLATIGPQVAGGLLLSGHTDVVAAGDGWQSDPYSLTVVGDNLVGRGSADMKGFIACLLVVFEDIDATTLTRPVHVALSYDEEIGCVGVRSLIEHLLTHHQGENVRPDLVLVGEPTTMRPRHEHLGKVAYRVAVTAQAAHSSLSPFLPSAIGSAARIIAALDATIQPHLQHAHRDATGEPIVEVTANVGRISGGSALNVLAPECEFTFELRHSTTHDPDQLLIPLWQAIETERAALQQVGGGVDVVEIASYPALATEPSNPWVRMVERAADRGVSTPLGFGTEGGLFANALNAAVVVCGPGDIAVAHRPDEYVPTDQLLACVRVLRQLIDDVCVSPHEPT